MSVKCSSCGHENEDRARICKNCGADLLESTVAYTPDKESLEIEAELREPAEKKLLVIIYPEELKQIFELKDGIYHIGRNPDSDIFLNDATVSRDHAELIVAGEKALIRDRGSLNGTFVNEKLLDYDEELSDGDIIQIGRFKLLFRSGEVREDD